MGGGPSKNPPIDAEESPTQIHDEDGGFRLLEVNLSRNGDSDAHNFWSIAFIMASTLVMVYIARRVWLNRQRRKQRRAAKRASGAQFYNGQPQRLQSAASFPAIQMQGQEQPPPKIHRGEVAPHVELDPL